MSHVQVAALIAASIQIVLALTVWSMLHERWPRRSLLLWVGGSLALAVGATLFAAQGSVAHWASEELAGALLSLAPAMRIAALRIDLQRPPRLALLAALCLLDFGLFVWSVHHTSEAARLMLGFGSMAAWTLALAWHAAQAGRELQSRSGLVLAIVELLFAAALILRTVAMAAGWTETQGLAESWDFGLLVATGVAAAIYGNLGYLGLVLDRTGVVADAARQSQVAESVRRQAAEAHAQDLAALLAQREAMLQMLAHEIRQPLHNAGIVLQSASSTLAGSTAMPADEFLTDQRRLQTEARLDRAQAVLSDVLSVLDNTLAAAKLLTRADPPVLVDTELDFVVRLSLGDLPAALRDRVSLQGLGRDEAVPLEPGMVRLAVRNLLANAFEHGGPEVRVCIQVEHRDHPPRLLLRVVDDGVGLPPQMLADAIAGTRASGEIGQRRQGLAIVRRVMQLHGGALDLRPAQPTGLVAELQFQSPRPPTA